MKTLTQTTKATSATATKKTKLVASDRITTERVIKEKWVRAQLMVPAEYAAMLVVGRSCADYGSACVWKDGEQTRIAQWLNPYKLNGVRHPAKKTLLETILQKDLDAPLTYAIPAAEWDRIKSICKTLEISTCDYLLAATEYNFHVKRRKVACAALIA